MNGPDRADPEAEIAFAVRELLPRGESAPCPDPNLLCGYAEGRLQGAGRAALETHLARCEPCRVVTAELARDRPAPAASRRPWLVLSLAAAALVCGAVAVFATRPAGTGVPPEPTEKRLVAAAHDLVAADPALFAGFEPLEQRERLAPGANLQRGGGTPLHPCERILETRPTFRFEAEGGAAPYEVALLTADGTPLWRRQTAAAELPFPADEPELQPGAKYLWKLTARGPLADATPSGRAFEVAGAAVRDRFAAAAAAIGERAPSGLGPLLRAHLALRSRFLAEAERAARAFAAANPDDEVGRETLYCALNAVGAAEADGLRPRLGDGRGR